MIAFVVLVVANAFDSYTTHLCIRAGLYEVNPVLRALFRLTQRPAWVLVVKTMVPVVAGLVWNPLWWPPVPTSVVAVVFLVVGTLNAIKLRRQTSDTIKSSV